MAACRSAHQLTSGGGGARLLGGLVRRAGATFGQPGHSDRGLEAAPGAYHVLPLPSQSRQ
jgi:hypothetical protein